MIISESDLLFLNFRFFEFKNILLIFFLIIDAISRVVPTGQNHPQNVLPERTVIIMTVSGIRKYTGLNFIIVIKKLDSDVTGKNKERDTEKVLKTITIKRRRKKI